VAALERGVCAWDKICVGGGRGCHWRMACLQMSLCVWKKGVAALEKNVYAWAKGGCVGERRGWKGASVIGIGRGCVGEGRVCVGIGRGCVGESCVEEGRVSVREREPIMSRP